MNFCESRVIVIGTPTVICESAHHADYEPSPSHGLRPPIGSIVCVFPEDSSVFLVDANDVLDNKWTSIMGNKRARLYNLRVSEIGKLWTNGIFLANQIVNLPQAIASKRQLIGHRAHSVFTPKTKIRSFTRDSNYNLRVKGKFPGMGRFRSTIRDNHFC